MDILKEVRPMVLGFEGCDCSGKSTLIKHVQDELDKAGIESVILHKIHEGPVKDIILNDRSLSAVSRMILLGFCYIETENRVKKALDEGKWVLLDRTSISRRVYQERMEQLWAESKALTSLIGPEKEVNYLCFVNQPEEVIMERLAAKKNHDVFEERNVAYHQAVYHHYQLAVEEFARECEYRRQIPGFGTLNGPIAPMVVSVTGDMPLMMAQEFLDNICEDIRNNPQFKEKA